MANYKFDHADEAFTLIEKLDSINNAEGVVDAVAESLSRFGFEYFIITGLPHPEERVDQVVLLRRWPEGWFEIYLQEDYARVDPVVRMCRGTLHPFEWSQAPYNPECEPRAAEVMRRATDFRMSRGFCLPIHGPQGYEACVSMSGIHLDLTARTKPALHLIAMYAFERARQILKPDRLPRYAGLTPREREIRFF